MGYGTPLHRLLRCWPKMLQRPSHEVCVSRWSCASLSRQPLRWMAVYTWNGCGPSTC